MVFLSAPGDAILSLGTSTTFILSIPPSEIPPKRLTTSHLLAHPTTRGAYISMLCHRNGALAREQVRDCNAAGNWDRFNQLVVDSPPGNDGYIWLYFPLPEIIPPNMHGEYSFLYHDIDKPHEAVLAESIPSIAKPRAILESQFLLVRSHIARIVPANSRPFRRLVLTGGSATNQAIQQVAADVFGMPVHVTIGSESKDAACIGGAILAKYSWSRHIKGAVGNFEEMDHGDINRLMCVAEPKEEASGLYDKLVEVFRSCEEQINAMQV
jgi:xylulokinase